MAGNTVVQVTPFNDMELRSFKTFADVGEALKNKGVEVIEVSNGFKVIDDLDTLKDVKFAILGTRFHLGGWGEYVILEIMTEHDQKGIITDGGTGIYRQMKDLVTSRMAEGLSAEEAGMGILVEGITRSDYFRNKNSGEISKTFPDGASKQDWEPGRTYYLNS